MAVKQQVFHIAACDICGAELDEAGDTWAWDTSRVLALEHIADHPDWTEVEGGIVCPRSDQAHDEARGAGSPVPQPGRDSMAVSFQTD
jgi:hypothetical protein